jgi:D-aminopeptidase
MSNNLRQLEVPFAGLPPGPYNAITDVPGVKVGHVTLVKGEGPLRPGEGPVRTGVTVILPHGGSLFREPVPAAVFTINGFGKPVGFEQVRELGLLESPVALTNTLNVGIVMDALVSHALLDSPEIGIHASTVNVVVAETNDGFLNDIQGRHVRQEHVFQALESAAGGPVLEGAIGAGAGTVCFGWKGGIGSASRVLPEALGGFRVGALLQTNYGQAADLRIAGVPVGRMIAPPPAASAAGPGSVIAVLATDAPLDARQLQRLCGRVGAGLARTGAVHSHGSGDFAIAFSTAYTIPRDARSAVEKRPALANEGRALDGLFRAVVESVEEAALSSLAGAETTCGRDGHTAYALPLDQIAALFSQPATK